MDEVADQHRILHARSRLDTACHIDGMRTDSGDGGSHIPRRKPACQNHPPVGILRNEPRGKSPVDRVTGSSIGAGNGGIQKEPRSTVA